MRKLFTSLLLAVALSLPVAVVAPVGCSTSQQRTTVNTLFTTGQTVDAAYKSYLDLVIAGQLKTNDVPAISQRYLEFQKAFSIAVTLSTISSNAPPTPEMANSASQVLLAIKAAKGK